MVRVARWLALMAACLGWPAAAAAGPAAAPLSATAASPGATAVPLSATALALSGTAGSLSGTAGSLSGTAAALSPSADALLPLPPRPTQPPKTHNSALESFVGVTLLSAPFTAFWSVLGALAVESVAQRQFPPDFGRDRAKATLSGAGAVAVGSSLMIGLVSIHWGGSDAGALSPSAQPLSPAPRALSPGAQAASPRPLSPSARP